MDPSASAIVEKSLLQAKYDQAEQAELSEQGGSSISGSRAGPAGSSISPGDTTGTSSYASVLEGAETDESTPPPYSGPSTSAHAPPSQPSQGPSHFPGLPRLDYKLYSPQLFELSPDCIALSSKAPYLSTSATALVTLIRSLSTVPPKPHIHLVGARGRKVDFDVKLNLMSLLVPENPRDRMDYIRCVGEGETAFRGGTKQALIPHVGDGGLEEWCRRFIDDPNSVKSFALDRVVANLDTTWIEGHLRSLIASTDYKGVVRITFPVTHAKVVVHSPDKVNKFFTSITTLFAGKHQYEVVQAVWPFATARNGEPGRRCIVQSEEAWWRTWRDVIKYAVATKRHGWVTNEDKLEALMEGKGKGVDIVDWGPDF
jgi:hypothetical protein